MPFNAASLRPRLTGGTSNTSPALSLGGPRSTIEARMQSAVAVFSSLDPRVDILYCDGVRQRSTGDTNILLGSGTTLQLIARGKDGPLIDVSEGGLFLLEDDVYPNVTSSMAVMVHGPVPFSGGVTVFFDVEEPAANLFSDLTIDQARNGLVDYRCLWVQNIDGSANFSKVRVYIQTQGSATYAIGLAPEGPGDGHSYAIPQALPDPFTPPSGVTFSTPNALNVALEAAGTVWAQEGFGLWVRRTVAPNPSAVAGPTNPALLAFATEKE